MFPSLITNLLKINNMTDERKDKMSGSAMASYHACAGKYQLEITCPPSESGAAAVMGNRIHQYMQDPMSIILTDEEQEIADRCQVEYEEIREAINLGEPDSTTLERRLWYGDQWSGQIDRIDHFGDETALVVDWKTGRVGTGNSAAENLQLRSYAVLVKKNLPNLKRILVAIVQPMAAKFTIAEYNEDDLIKANEQIQFIVRAALAPNAPRTPSPDACKYCRAKSICPEAGGVVGSLAKVSTDSVPSLTNEKISEYLEMADVVEVFIESIREEAKRRLVEGHQIVGRKLTSGRTSRSVDSVNGLVPLLADHLSTDDILACCKVSLPQLEKTFAAKTDMATKDAKAALEKAISEVLVSKTSAPIMVRAK